MNGEQQPITKEILTDILKKEVILPIGEKLDSMAGQISDLQAKVGGLENQVSGVETSVGGLENRFSGLETRVGGLENKVDNLYDKISDLQDYEFKQDTRTDEMESRLERKITEFKDDILTSNDQLSKKMDKILVETASHTAAYKRHDVQLDGHEKRLKVLELKTAS